jgi:hypothetical protein
LERVWAIVIIWQRQDTRIAIIIVLERVWAIVII